MKNHMMKVSLLSVATVAFLGLSGCGDESSNAASARTSTTGVGFYVDSAVSGVEYACGTQKGVTDEDGKFIFERGEGCTFSLAGVMLRETQAEKLVDDVKIVEDDIDVARFLQSIDDDGDASNGIKISSAIKAALAIALEGAGSAGRVPSDDLKIGALVSGIAAAVPGFKGKAKTKEKAKEHLKGTQRAVIQELLAGKTFYQVGKSDSDVWLNRVVFNADVTSVNVTEADSEKVYGIAVEGNKIIPSGDSSVGHRFEIVFIRQAGNHLLFEDYAEGSKKAKSKYYFDQAKAQDAYDEIKSAAEASALAPSENSETLFAEKTVPGVVGANETELPAF